MKTLVKLTHESVINEIETVLHTYPYQPYQQAFALPDLRQELIHFVLNQIPYFDNFIAEGNSTINKVEKSSIFSHKLSRNPLEQKLHLQQLIHQGIFAIFQQKSGWISHCLRETVEPACEPSHWFG
ncbi:hypothetical protein B6N60_02163 [Richelia sinica FACHB-800]|uniref:Uncharacterized protein n=1 Tax=Richelia sinica FACHB-800 TaxID=1357546 RepID=A0A975Y4S1_9NOST|nr:hypothetical protein [Richelia sinica]MBD2667449.1 hypothetical protein [Richelia sinica FACHB-800]QXE23473.1 hypothetical protein B6N60_02163 [Richelia sinica FACHB-800]